MDTPAPEQEHVHVKPLWPKELHISDVRTYLSCRRRWDWSSPLRGHLEPIYKPIYFTIGTAVHFALATFYETGEYPSDIYRRYMAGAIKQFEEATGTLWEMELEELNAAMALGIGMLDNYLAWIRSTEAPDERWQTVSTETAFGPMPLRNPAGSPSNRITLAGRFDGVIRDRDTGLLWLREYKTAGREPNEKWLELDNQATTYAWAAQQILGEPIAGVQFRFLMKKVPEKPRRLKNGTLSRAINSQLSTTEALYKEAIADLVITQLAERYKLPEDHVRTMIFTAEPDTQQMLDLGDATAEEAAKFAADFKDAMEAPENPFMGKMVIQGNAPIAVAPQPNKFIPYDTGYRGPMYEEYLAGLKVQLYEYAPVLDELAGRGYGEYFKEIAVPRTQAELDAIEKDLWLIGLEMVRDSTPIYASPEWLKCNFCAFKAPCKLKNNGGNYEDVLKYQYQRRKYEDPVETMNRIEW